MFTPPGDCPNCGADVPRKAKACPECGADAQSGWNEEALSDGLDLPEDSFDYREFLAEEFGEGKSKKGIKPIWWITALSLLLFFVLVFLLGVL